MLRASVHRRQGQRPRLGLWRSGHEGHAGGCPGCLPDGI